MTTTFFTYTDTLVKRKRKAGKHATADLYRASSNWFRRFCGNAELSFADITPGMIDRFQTGAAYRDARRNRPARCLR